MEQQQKAQKLLSDGQRALETSPLRHLSPNGDQASSGVYTVLIP